MVQAGTIMTVEAKHSDEVPRHGPSVPALRSLDAIYDRLESPTDRLLRRAGARSSYRECLKSGGMSTGAI